MALIEVLKSRLSRTKEKREAIEIIVNRNAASPNQKQQFVELKAKQEELEFIIDIAAGMLQESDN